MKCAYKIKMLINVFNKILAFKIKFESDININKILKTKWEHDKKNKL